MAFNYHSIIMVLSLSFAQQQYEKSDINNRADLPHLTFGPMVWYICKILLKASPLDCRENFCANPINHRKHKAIQGQINNNGLLFNNGFYELVLA